MTAKTAAKPIPRNRAKALAQQRQHWDHHTGPIKDRFLARVDLNAQPPCHIWTGPIMNSGYGYLYTNGKIVHARHLAIEIHRGQPFVKGHRVKTTCGNRLCVNYDHLRETKPKSRRLRSEEAQYIVQAYKTKGLSVAEMARRLEVSYQQVHKVIYRYKHPKRTHDPIRDHYAATRPEITDHAELVQLREDAFLPRTYFARTCKIPAQKYKLYEEGKQRITAKHWRKICEHFEINPPDKPEINRR